MNKKHALFVLLFVVLLSSCGNKKIVFNSKYFNLQEEITTTYNEMFLKLDEEAKPLSDYEKSIAFQFAQGVYSLVMKATLRKEIQLTLKYSVDKT